VETGWIRLVEIIPSVVLYGIGQFAVWLAAVSLLLAIVSLALEHVTGRPGRLPAAARLLLMALIAAVPGAIYLASDRGESREPQVESRKKLPSPFGKGWPKETGYVDAKQFAQGGTGVIRITAGYANIFVKLCEPGQAQCLGLRTVFLRGRTSFELRDLAPGRYEVRYMPIEHPGLGGRSEPIEIRTGEAAPVVLEVGNSLGLNTRKGDFTGIGPDQF
jgi:hypothetical protein